MSESLVYLGIGYGMFGFAFRWAGASNSEYFVGLGSGMMIGAYLTTLYADTTALVQFFNSAESAILVFSFILGYFLGGTGHRMWEEDDAE